MRILLGVLLGLVALSMLTYLVPNYNTGGGATDVVVAKVGDSEITLPEVQKTIQATVRGRQLPPEILPNFIPQMVDSLVTERALEYEARKLGFEVTDQQVADAIKQYIPALFPDGKFVGRDMYAGYLAQQNMTIPEFEAQVKRQLLITRLRNVALEGTIVTPGEIEQEYKRKNEKIKLQYVKVTQDKYRNQVQPSAEDMQNYYKANGAKYQMPERKSLAILIADQKKLEATVNPTDAELQRAYTQNQAQFRVPETVKVEHILLMTQGKPASEEGAIKAKADDLLKQVRAGANFQDLVNKYSEDPGKTTNHGEYSVQRNGQMVKEFEDEAFTLKPGESGIVKTTYGYHIVKVLQHDPARLRPFDEVKGELAATWKKQRVSDLMQQASDRAQTALQKDPTHPEKVAAEFNMDVIHANNVEAGKPVPEIGQSPDFDTAIATLKKGEVSQPVALQGDKIALAVVTDVQPPRPMTFEEAQSQVKDALVQSRLVREVQKNAELVAGRAAENGGDLAAAAKAFGLEAKTTDEFARGGSVEGLGPASYVEQAFSKPDGAIVGPISVTDGTVVAKVVAHIAPDMSKLPEQRVAIREDLKRQKAQARNSLFDAGLKDTLVKNGTIKYHKEVIERLISSYRG